MKISKTLAAILFVLLPLVLFAQIDTLWTRQFPFAGDDYPADLIQTSDNGFALAASSNHNALDIDFLLIKTNSNGDTLWTRSYPRQGIDFVFSLLEAPDNGYLLVGSTLDLGSLHSQMYLIKTDSQGHFEWDRTYGEENKDDGITAILPYPAGYLLIGNTTTDSTSVITTRRINSAGDELWTSGYTDEDTRLYANCAIPTVSGGFALAGYYIRESQSQNVLALKADSAGNLFWFRNYGSEGIEEATAIHETANGQFFISGLINSTGQQGEPEADFLLIKTNSSGDTLWTQVYGGEGEQHSHDGVISADGDYIMAGHTEAVSDGNVYLVKAGGQNGALLWSADYGEEEYQGAEAIVRLEDNGYAVLAQNLHDLSGSDIFLLRFAPEQTNAAEENFISNPSSLSLSVYPNPFNSEMHVAFELKYSQPVELKLFDLSGRIVASIADEFMAAGTQSLNFNAKELSSGIYFCQLRTSQTVKTQKIVLLK